MTSAQNKRPYVARCGFCEQGLLRLLSCRACGTVAAICDECELLWNDVPAVYADAESASAGAFPACPECGASKSEWDALTPEDARDLELEQYLTGESP